jgi:arylsulfatase A-like enzyme
VPGINIGEHLTHLAKHTDKMALVRSVTHTDNNHSTSAHWMLTGHKHRLSAENFGASPNDFPQIGSVVGKLTPAHASLPTFVALPEIIATTAGAVVPGQDAGRLGRQYDPFRINEHPDKKDFKVASLSLPDDMQPVRVTARHDLLATFNAARHDLELARRVDAIHGYQQRAADLITSTRAREAFNLAAESDKDKDRYGRQTFGQSVLLARRLLEAGVKLVTVYWHRDDPGVDTTWDTHAKNFSQLKERLIPQIDQPLASLFEDLSERGMLDDTLVLWTSEFGRTPKINGNAGRDHWGACNTVWLAGGGVPGGQVFGRSDKHAAYPASDPVGPADIAATAYHLLGIPPHSIIHDREDRPHTIAPGNVLSQVLGGTATGYDREVSAKAE